MGVFVIVCSTRCSLQTLGLGGTKTRYGSSYIAWQTAQRLDLATTNGAVSAQCVSVRARLPIVASKSSLDWRSFCTIMGFSSWLIARLCVEQISAILISVSRAYCKKVWAFSPRPWACGRRLALAEHDSLWILVCPDRVDILMSVGLMMGFVCDARLGRDWKSVPKLAGI